VIAAFTERLHSYERCTPKDAVEFAWLTRLPREHFPELRALFPTSEEQEEFNRTWERSLEEELRLIRSETAAAKLQCHNLVAIDTDGYISRKSEESLFPPRSEFNPHYLEEWEYPSGAVKLSDPLYVERDADKRIKLEIVKSGTTVTIRAPRQTGKTSLLMRALHLAHEQELKILFCDLQGVDRETIDSLENFLHYLAQFVYSELDFDVMEVESLWQTLSLPPKYRLTNLMNRVLDKSDIQIVLAVDEADRLLQTGFHADFFALIRSWHNKRAYSEQWNKLSIVMVISTEPHLLINDANQSPFNVGLKLTLEDFTAAQVRDLNQRHGSPLHESDFSQFMHLLSGHPYLTRLALYTLVTEGLAWRDLNCRAINDQGPFGEHLRHQYMLLRDEPVLGEALKQVIRNGNYQDDMALYRLLRAGLIRGSGERYACRCGLYERYFREKLCLR
jgi:hypothetical protein